MCIRDSLYIDKAYCGRHTCYGCAGYMDGCQPDVLPYLPVSYTHLDVYKRQALSNRLRLNAGLHYTLFHITGKTYHSIEPRASIRYPVSYTHLIFNRPTGRIEKFSPKPVGRKAGLQIFRGPDRSFAP